jgi:hypothetical protein
LSIRGSIDLIDIFGEMHGRVFWTQNEDYYHYDRDQQSYLIFKRKSQKEKT